MTRPAAGINAVPPLTGALPAHCQSDLNTLRQLVRSAALGTNAEAAVSPTDFREVLVTGATGFMGRFLVRDLLAGDPDMGVHCIVRAKSAEHGLERLRTSMELADVWEDAFATRIRVHAGDIAEARFGLGEADFTRLCRRVDAVYHFAAAMSLASSYLAIRAINTFALRNVLELCFHTRRKHLFHASTLGIFPQYFCGFAREYSDSRIDHQMQPDTADMKRMFPVGLLGYPWSKLVAEQAVLFAGLAGLPVALFRLPQTGLASTGFAQPNDIIVRIFSSVNDVRVVPTGFVFQSPHEAVDALTRICLDISLNPQRRFTIYQCSDTNPAQRDFKLEEFGWHYPEVSYETFKRTCRARGKASPLSGHWALLDHFAPYWFRGGGIRTEIPVCDRAMREDCPRPIEWPGPLTKHVRHYNWIRSGPESWPHPLPPNGRLEYDRLVAQARDYAADAGVPFESTYPNWMLRALERQVRAIKAPEAGIEEDKLGFVVYDICRLLRNNAYRAKERQRFPQINDQKIVRPVFIVGMNRTGTTYLHRLLARAGRFQVLRSFELVEPVLRSGNYAAIEHYSEDPRRTIARDTLGASGMARALEGIHQVGIDEPEEDFPILRHAFASWISTIRYRLPEFETWLLEAGCRDAYAYHHRTMQQYTWHRSQTCPGVQARWLFKMPFHLMELDALTEVYPDARFIQTHREPVQFMGSWNSLVERVRSVTSAPQEPEQLGREQLAFMARMLERAIDFRTSHPELEHRWTDVSYFDMVEDPMAVVAHIYDRFGWPLEEDAVARMEDWLEEQRERRRKETRHKYDIGDYGLTREMIDAAFARYREFLSESDLRASLL